MLMQKSSPNHKAVENDDINVNSVDSLYSNGHFFAGRNTSLIDSECNDDCSSDEDSHEHDITEQENQTTFVDGNRKDLQCKSSLKNKKTKSVKVKFAGTHDDKTGIKLKIRRTNNLNQDENHVIVDGADEQRKRHLKNKRCKSLGLSARPEDGSDDNLPHKRSKTESEDDFRASIGVNTVSKGTEVEDALLGQCQTGTRLSLESVVLMETASGILIVSVQWRGKTLMGALMESERFQMGSLEKDSIYRREKMMGLNRRNTRRKAKNLFGKKKRKMTTPTDSGEHGGGTENEAANSDGDNPYSCDKQGCRMRFADLQTLRVHIYQKHRARSKGAPPAQQREPLPDLAAPRADPGEERAACSPAYSDISDANEAPVLESEAVCAPAAGLVLGPLPPLHVSAHMLFSPSAPALQPEVALGPVLAPSLAPTLVSSIGSSLASPMPLSALLPGRPPAHFRFSNDPGPLNGYLHSPLPTNHKLHNGAPNAHPDTVQDLSVRGPLGLHKYGHKPTEPHRTAHSHGTHKQAGPRQHHHSHTHSSHVNGLNQHSKHALSIENGLPPNGIPLSHSLPFMSFSPSVNNNNQNSKLNYPISQLSLYPKY